MSTYTKQELEHRNEQLTQRLNAPDVGQAESSIIKIAIAKNKRRINRIKEK